jgi:glycosyltransferase involved in cell wall biosynthesis
LIGQIKSTKITQHKPLFVNIHWVGHATISLRQISKIDIPVLITAHDEWWLNATSHYSESEHSGKKFFVKKQILKKIVGKKAEILRKKNVGIVCLNKEMAENFLVNFPYLRGRIKVIPNPVDNSIYFPMALSDRVSEVPTAAYLGGFSDTRKGYDLMQEALKKCHEKFNVVATGLKGDLISGAHGQIRIIGIPRISDGNNLNRLYNKVAITIVPSRQEALPQVATESLMSGTPVISFRVGGLKDIVIDGQTGVPIENFDTSDFATKLDKYMRLPTKAEMHTEIFATANFTGNVVTKKYYDFYMTISNQ